MKNKPLIIIGVIILIIVGYIVNQTINTNNNEPIIPVNNNEPTKPRIYVQITGEVLKPGIYEMNEDDRVNDLIIVAGGLTTKADSSQINLVEKLSDGMIVYIRKNTSNDNKKQISINNASLEELMSLKGIGEAKAQNIINYRELNGSFVSITDLLNVNGISDNILNGIKDDVCL